jgi:hypothetical protein
VGGRWGLTPHVHCWGFRPLSLGKAHRVSTLSCHVEQGSSAGGSKGAPGLLLHDLLQVHMPPLDGMGGGLERLEGGPW